MIEMPQACCISCAHVSHCEGERAKAHIPYRDKASQLYLHPEWSPQFREDEDEKQPPAEEKGREIEDVPIPLEEDNSEDDEKPNVENTVPDLPTATPKPSLQEYRERWAEKLAWHSRESPGDFGDDDLIPKKFVNLFQDAPHVPFSSLVSRASQARIAVCRPLSSFTEANRHDGVPRYMHCTGLRVADAGAHAYSLHRLVRRWCCRVLA